VTVNVKARALDVGNGHPRTASSQAAPLLIPRSLATALLRLYDYPDPRRPNTVIRGYDVPHAMRTARMCAAVATKLGHSAIRLVAYQIACLLHDLGRAGLDQRRFGAIWSWARKHGIPTRPREWRARFPKTPYGRETEAFLARYRDGLRQAGIPLDDWTHEQVEMRLGYARRFRRRLRDALPRLAKLGVSWKPWMGRIILYYYYPERLQGASGWVRQLAEILVACEQFEAYSNRRRGEDYYRRDRETVADAFAYLNRLRRRGILSATVIRTIRDLAAEGAFDRIIAEAQGGALSRREWQTLRGAERNRAVCR
jgi:hypothetical protein